LKATFDSVREFKSGLKGNTCSNCGQQWMCHSIFILNQGVCGISQTGIRDILKKWISQHLTTT
ncbi:MAG: hypothetical protein NTX38_04355, partial [Methylobacter sp.]|nr:hypothetical protein [Methylobacter sp.]